MQSLELKNMQIDSNQFGKNRKMTSGELIYGGF